MKLPEGFKINGLNCGIKRENPDLGLISASGGYLAVEGFFTKNANPSYSVTLSKKNVKKPIKAIIVNSGNANCYSHKTGLKDTESITCALADELKVKPDQILICSTGIIGKKLPKEKIIKNISKLVSGLGDDPQGFAKSILTTDSFHKVSYGQVSCCDKSVNILGFAKGAGMIYPDMATMLGFILTDVSLPKAVFKKIAKEAVEESFNSISVDGCTSTNDTVFFASSKKVPLKKDCEIKDFKEGLKAVCLDLAKMIVRDGEGATKFVQITLKGAKTEKEAKEGAFALANSSLFKCALYGANSNWGRIISALGQIGIKVKQDIVIEASDLKSKDINIMIDLKRGKKSWSVYTCDLTPKYIEINAEYS